MEAEQINIKKVSSVVKDIGNIYRECKEDIIKFDEKIKVYMESCEDVELTMLIYEYYQEKIIEK